MKIQCLILLAVAITSVMHAAPLSGTKTIGPAGDYASIGAAIADVQAQTLGGALVLELKSDYVSAVETFPLVFTNLTTTAANTLTLRPAVDAVALSITSANTTAATVDLNDAQFVTIDGRAGGSGTAKQLTIANTSTSGIALRFINEASSNTIRHTILRSVNTSATSGTVVFSTTTGANGNDNNIIETCDIRDGASTPANGIYALGTTATPAQNNSGNTISNCNVFDFYRSSAIETAGVRLDGGNTNWTITGSSFYQTVTRAAVAARVRAIYVNNIEGNEFSVTGNFIGGDSPGAEITTQKWTTSGTTLAYRFVGIQINAGTTTPSSVQGNVIRNITWTTSSSANMLPGIWSAVYVSAGNANIGTLTGNTVGSGTGTGSVAVTTSGSGGWTFGIASGGGGVVAITNNVIGSITTNGTGTTIASSLAGIEVITGVNTIADNTVGSTISANSLNAATSCASSAPSPVQEACGVLCYPSSSATITGNTVANLNNNQSGTGRRAICGILASDGVDTISGNIVYSLSTTSTTTGTGRDASVVGIYASSSVTGQTVSHNVVHSLSAKPSTNSAGVSNVGIFYEGYAGSIERNLVHSLAIVSTSGLSTVNGMYFGEGTFTAQNNMVRAGFDANGTTTAGRSVVRGLYDFGTMAGRNFYHNSVYVGGTQTAGTSSSYAFQSVGISNTREFCNNIFVNARSNSGASSKHYAVSYGGTTANPAGLTATNNLFFTTGGVLGFYNAADRTTLTGWQAATGLDASSAMADPLFVNPTGDATTVDLHLQASNPTEGGGVLIGNVIDDFDGDTRSSLTPVDIGADAGSFSTSSGDIYAPFITYPLLPSGSTANRILTGWARIVDNSGTSATRLYYKKSTDADVFNAANDSTGNGWKYAIGTDSGGGNYSFTIDYSVIHGGSVSSGDTIQYFVVAQDSTNNLSSNPAAATAFANPPVQNISGKPGAGVNSYNIVDTFSGTLTVGPGGAYPNLSGSGGLFAALNTGLLTGDLTVNVTGDTIEDGSNRLYEFKSNGVNYPPTANTFTVLIRPDSAAMRTLSGSKIVSGLISLSGAQRVTLDGSFEGSGRYLTFRNTWSYAPTIEFINDASNNTVRNCVIEGATAFATTGVVTFSTGVTTGNDNNTVTGNQIRDRSDAAGMPIYAIYSSGTSNAVANSNNVISNNEMFNFTQRGVYLFSGNDSWNISGNAMYETAAQGVPSLDGIFSTAEGLTEIRGNTIHDLTTSGAASGIYVANPTGNTTVADNRLWNLGNTAGSSSFARGIAVSPGAEGSVTAVNNMIVLGSSGPTGQSLYGIRDFGVSGSKVLVANNAVLITGTTGNGYSWAYNTQGSSSATVKNNVFLNLRTGIGSQFAANYGAQVMDSNVYAGTGQDNPANFFDASGGGSSTGTPISYTQWQVNVPSDTHSSAGNPGGNFTSAMFVDAANGDLHLVPGGNILVNGKGTPVAGVTTDFDGDPRPASTPTIGADEFFVPGITVSQTSALMDGISSVDLGEVNVGTSSAALTFTITNPGTADLTGLAVNKDGANAADFAVSALSSTSVAADTGIATFTVTFTPSAGGTRTAAIHIASNMTGTRNPFDIALIGSGLVTQSTWRQTWFGTTINSGDAADTYDYDHDGLVNLVEYAFGLNPTLGSSNQLPQGQLIGGNFVISFTQPAGMSGVVYGAEWSATMQPLDWHTIPDTGTPPQHVFSVPATGQIFVRLKVTGQ